MATIDGDVSMIGFEESDYEDDDESFVSMDEENLAPVAKRPASKGKKAASQKTSILSQRSDNATNVQSQATGNGAKKKRQSKKPIRRNRNSNISFFVQIPTSGPPSP